MPYNARIQLYQALAEHILSCPELELKWCDLWNSQTEYQDQEVYPRPAVFISFEGLNWTSPSHGIQEAEATVSLFVEQELYAQSYYRRVAGQSGASRAKPGEVQAQALKRFELLHALSQRVQGFVLPNVCSPLTRISETPDVDFPNVTLDIIAFSTTLQEVLPAGYDLHEAEPQTERLATPWPNEEAPAEEGEGFLIG